MKPAATTGRGLEMWPYILGIAIGIGSRLMGYELDTKEALLVILIIAVLSTSGTREKNQS